MNVPEMYIYELLSARLYKGSCTQRRLKKEILLPSQVIIGILFKRCILKLYPQFRKHRLRGCYRNPPFKHQSTRKKSVHTNTFFVGNSASNKVYSGGFLWWKPKSKHSGHALACERIVSRSSFIYKRCPSVHHLHWVNTTLPFMHS